MRSACAAVLLVSVAVASVAASAPAGDSMSFERARATITTRDGRRIALRVELAITPEQRGVGLMGRRTLARNAGMLFLYARDRRGPFWMKSIRIPLAIAFLDQRGRILRMLRMEPCRADPCPLYDPGIAYRSALEVRAGSFARWRVKRGDIVRLVRR
jgi:uncharacterized membrane protein (UPF0127 family)